MAFQDGSWKHVPVSWLPPSRTSPTSPWHRLSSQTSPTPIVMKCSERLVLAYIKNSLSSTLDQQQYAYRTNKSNEHIPIHTTLNHLDGMNTWTCQCYLLISALPSTPSSPPDWFPNSTLWETAIHCSSGLQTSLQAHLSLLGWVTTPHTPQGSVQSPVLYTLYTYNCITKHSSNGKH